MARVNTAAHKVSEQLYKTTGASPEEAAAGAASAAGEAPPPPPGGKPGGDGDVIEPDYEVKS